MCSPVVRIIVPVSDHLREAFANEGPGRPGLRSLCQRDAESSLRPRAPRALPPASATPALESWLVEARRG
jgi:hypothetical protein